MVSFKAQTKVKFVQNESRNHGKYRLRGHISTVLKDFLTQRSVLEGSTNLEWRLEGGEDAWGGRHQRVHSLEQRGLRVQSVTIYQSYRVSQ